MSIKQLQYDIKSHGGYILSDGTLNLQHLLPKAYDLIKAYEIRQGNAKSLAKQILEVFEVTERYPLHHEAGVESILDPKKPGLFNAQYWSWVKLKEGSNAEEAHSFGWTQSWLWNECVFELFNRFSPRGYYFGSSEGDGACIGWFKYEEEGPPDHGSEPSDDIEQYLP